MRLTQDMRQAFVRQVMADVPAIDYKEMIRKAVYDDALAQMPPKVLTVWNNEEDRGWVQTWCVHLGGVSVAIPCVSRDDFKLRPKAAKQVEDLQKKAEAQTVHHDDLKQKLRNVALSVNTTKALAAALPEFAKYMPKDPDAALRTLPVLANVVTDFVKAGWPKGGKKKAEARAAA